ncbi:hypothetical protein V0288_03610 [Pannus brasiliensis CCIBt3594]|uniref:Uncharacterized protein n=1 Tax=Pannus brasiliensis CCIBt3594 TaxID=1427578 RepID=A0AAW9QM26_9CHRO
MENVTEKPLLSPKGTFPAQVVKVIDDYRLVINRGESNGIAEGQRMLVYNTSEEEITDPQTGESLGYLELVRGTGTITFVQEKISILQSDKTNNRKSRLLELLIDEQSTPTAPPLAKYMQKIVLGSNREEDKKPIAELIDRELLNKLLLRELSETLPFENPQIGDSVRPI